MADATTTTPPASSSWGDWLTGELQGARDDVTAALKASAQGAENFAVLGAPGVFYGVANADPKTGQPASAVPSAPVLGAGIGSALGTGSLILGVGALGVVGGLVYFRRPLVKALAKGGNL